ncbi:MAG: hypothetical protein DMG93_02455 [Acidobacteria bacterium]|nr:MAG: hypothetical protein DMG93_02455 [Acidobacteriota bacterium]
MSNTILTVRMPPDLLDWLTEESRRTGIPVGRLIREQLDRARKEQSEPSFMRHAGKISGPRDLSSRKGFSR